MIFIQSIMLLLALAFPPALYAGDKPSPDTDLPDLGEILEGEEPLSRSCGETLLPFATRPLGVRGLLEQIGRIYWDVATEGRLLGKPLGSKVFGQEIYVYGLGNYGRNVRDGFFELRQNFRQARAQVNQEYGEAKAKSEFEYARRAQIVDAYWGTNTTSLREFSAARGTDLFHYLVDFDYFLKTHYKERVWKKWLGLATRRFGTAKRLISETKETGKQYKKDALRDAQLTKNEWHSKLILMTAEARAKFHHLIWAIGSAACAGVGTAGTIVFIPLAPGTHIFIIAGEVVWSFAGIGTSSLVTLGAQGVLSAWNWGGAFRDKAVAVGSGIKKAGAVGWEGTKFTVGTTAAGGTYSVASSLAATGAGVVYGAGVLATSVQGMAIRTIRNIIFPAEMFEVKTGVEIAGGKAQEVVEKSLLVVPQATANVSEALSRYYQLKITHNKLGENFGSTLMVSHPLTAEPFAEIRIQADRGKLRVFCRVFKRQVEKLRLKDPRARATAIEPEFSPEEYRITISNDLATHINAAILAPGTQDDIDTPWEEDAEEQLTIDEDEGTG